MHVTNSAAVVVWLEVKAAALSRPVRPFAQRAASLTHRPVRRTLDAPTREKELMR